MNASNSILTQGPAPGEDIERYEVVDGVRVEREPLGAFETVLASWLCHVINSFATGKKLGLAVNEVLFVLNAARTLQRRPDVAFVSYARWPTSITSSASIPELTTDGEEYTSGYPSSTLGDFNSAPICAVRKHDHDTFYDHALLDAPAGQPQPHGGRLRPRAQSWNTSRIRARQAARSLWVTLRYNCHDDHDGQPRCERSMRSLIHAYGE